MADAAPQPTPMTDSRSFFQQLREGEHLWAWKFSLRVAICVLDIIGIGCAAWLVSTQSERTNVATNYFYFDFFVLPGSLTALSISLVWCLIVILVYLLRRPPSPIHPGVCVGIDLILWLGLIVTGLFTVGAVIALSIFGSGGYIEDLSYQSAYNGHYNLLNNGTWVYKIDYVSDPCDYNYYSKGCHYNSSTGEYTSNRTAANVHRHCDYFATCAQQDAYINQLWQQKPLLEGTEIMVAVAQWLGVLFHFILFVWACVDTHRYNSRTKRRYTQVDAQEIADRVIRDMEARGLITVHANANQGARGEGMEMSDRGQAVAGPSSSGQARAGPSSGGADADDMAIGRAQ